MATVTSTEIYEGLLQTCFLTYHNAHYTDWMTTANAKRSKEQTSVDDGNKYLAQQL
jgi:hypothetical protein